SPPHDIAHGASVGPRDKPEDDDFIRTAASPETHPRSLTRIQPSLNSLRKTRPIGLLALFFSPNVPARGGSSAPDSAPGHAPAAHGHRASAGRSGCANRRWRNRATSGLRSPESAGSPTLPRDAARPHDRSARPRSGASRRPPPRPGRSA